MFNKVLMVCVGNICRSPVAEGLLKHYFIQNQLSSHQVASAGIAALVGRAADPYSIELMQQRTVDIEDHRAQQLNAELIKAHDLVLVMETGHKKHIEAEFPFAYGKVHCLGKWRNEEIADPYQMPKKAFVAMVDHVEACLADWTNKCWPSQS